MQQNWWSGCPSLQVDHLKVDQTVEGQARFVGTTEESQLKESLWMPAARKEQVSANSTGLFLVAAVQVGKYLGLWTDEFTQRLHYELIVICNMII